jgi:hypothetical protein
VVTKQALFLPMRIRVLNPLVYGIRKYAERLWMITKYVFLIGVEQSGKKVPPLELDLLEGGGFENEIKGDPLVKGTDFVNLFINGQFESVSICTVGKN